MKNSIKLLGITAIIAVIGFSFTACEQPDDTTTVTLTGISAVYTQGSTIIYPTTPLNNLKAGLTVTARYSDNTDKTLNSADYSLSGDLSSSGQKTVTVTYEGETTTFNVTVTAAANNDITYTAIQTGGTDDIADSTGIVFTFSASVNSLNLTAADITVSGAAAKGDSATLTGTGATRTLAPITVNAAGLATVTIAKNGIEAIQKSVIIYKAGAYVPEYWSITWLLNGGAEGTGAYPTQIEKGTVLTRPSPDPTKDGSTFGGWYSDLGMAQPYTFANPVTTNLFLYAKWVASGSGTSMDDAIPLTENQWADGNIPTRDGEQWFTFTATASWQYIHFEFGTLTYLYVQVYDSSGTAVVSETYLSPSTSIWLTVGQTYYIRVRRSFYLNSSDDYRIGFGSIAPPGAAISLTENQWADGNLTTSNDHRQWFTFTATASTQYIHFAPGTLGELHVQVYDSNGATVGNETYFSSYYANTSLSLTPGQTYYIWVWHNSGDSGTYRIGFGSIAPPGAAIPLIENQWADGNIPTSSDDQWFTFTATASTQYIYVDFGTLTSVYVQVYDSSGADVGSETNLNSTTTNTSISLIAGQTYYIRVRPYSDYSGTYRIGFNTSFGPPGTIPLAENQYADGSIQTSNDQQWFTFTATASTQYIHVAFGTLPSLSMQVYDSSGAAVGDETELYSSRTNTSRTLTEGETYYIRVRPTEYGIIKSGDYRIGFNTSIVPPGAAIPLTENQWADGNIPTSGSQQWFTFTAAASTQYIHVERGTLTQLYVQVYDNSGAEVGSETGMGTTTRVSRSLITGQTYYIRVRPFSDNTGSYQIGFTASFVPPGVTPIPLTANQWADGNIPTSGNDQWFIFTATASTQYLHFEPGTLSSVSVSVYDNSGVAVGNQTSLSSTRIASRSLTAGQTYYIVVYSSTSGTYRIMFTASFVPPGVTPIQLTANQWADSNIPSGDVQWFRFTATASTQYIHKALGSLSNPLGIYVRVYDSSGAAVGSESYLYGGSTNTTSHTSRSLTSGDTYYIIVITSDDFTGICRIGFGSIAPPDAIPLTEHRWANGNLPTANNVQWFTFTATASTQYIHAAFGTLSSSRGIVVSVYDSSSALVERWLSLDSSTTYTSQSLTPGQTYYILVQPNSNEGTYQIGFNTSSIVPPGIPLTANRWTDGNLQTSSSLQWFTFTATASTQYIHASGTLTSSNGIYVQVYDSSGATVGSQTLLSSTTNISLSLTAGQTYYIRVWPYNGSGTYRIGFTASTTAPTS